MAGLVLALFAGACGAESKSNGSSGGDDAAESGSNSGGTSGTGTSGASSGGAGTNAGGTGGAGASSGSTSGGTSGSAGTGGGRGYRPPDHQLAGCNRHCELELAAMCPADDTFEKCVEGCHLGLLFEVCSEEWDAVFACTDLAESAECNAEGEATIPDCAAQESVALTCVLTDGITDDFADRCSPACVRSAAAMCPASDEAGCNFTCRLLGSAFPVCSGAYGTFAECSVAADYVCDEEGEAEPVGCAAAFGAFVDCIAAEYAWQPGRGIVP